MTTPIYALPFPAVGEPIRETRAKLEAMARAIEGVLASAALTPPSGAADYLTVVGKVNTADAATASTRLTLTATGATHYVDTNFDGVNYWRRGRVVTVAGAFTAGSALGGGVVLGILPAAHRPPRIVPCGGAALHVRATGEVITGAAVTAGATLSFSATFVTP